LSNILDAEGKNVLGKAKKCCNNSGIVDKCWGYVHHVATETAPSAISTRRKTVSNLIRRMWAEEQGQDIAEYAVMVAVILIIVVGTIRLIGSNSNTVFSSVASAIG
jgi:Flp pilus assembly pilin Flp